MLSTIDWNLDLPYVRRKQLIHLFYEENDESDIYIETKVLEETIWVRLSALQFITF